MAATGPSIRFSHKIIHNKNEEAKKNIHHSHLSSFIEKSLSQKYTTGFFLFLLATRWAAQIAIDMLGIDPSKFISGKISDYHLNKIIVLLPRKMETWLWNE